MRRSWPLLALLLWPTAAHASVPVCIKVEVKSWAPEAPKPPPAPAPAPNPPPAASATSPGSDPIRDFYAPKAAEKADAPPPKVHELDPAAYLQRLLEYEVTHAEGFVAAERKCSQVMVVELYPLTSGWTVFARYSGTGREEKVDRVELDEFESLAQRVARSLLENQNISETITRENVLRADSARTLRTVRGSGHAAFAMGQAVRVGELPTADSPDEPVHQELRTLTPIAVQLGYRLKIKSWGLDALTRVNFNAQQNTALRSNQLGGHVDYAGSGVIGLHFLRYFDSVGVNSLYAGGGASLELSLFDIIRAESMRETNQRSSLIGGGMNVDLLLGIELLRASVVHFFGQVELTVPTYAFDTENSAGSIRTYLPGGLVQVGVIL